MKKAENDNSAKSLSDFLREKRRISGLSQMQVAKALGYGSPQFISNWERGLSEPPIGTLKTIAKLYSVPIDEMFEVVLKSTLKKVAEDLRAKFNEVNK